MLIKCPECQLQLSDKAIYCPHCGYPLNIEKVTKLRKKYNKRKRLPNGFGQISEIKNQNLRNPFRAMISVGKTQLGKPIVKPLKPNSYFSTYNDAYAALIEYNRNPYDIDPAITVKSLYEEWSKIYDDKHKNKSSFNNLKYAWRYCSAIHDIKVSDLKARHIKSCMEKGTIIKDGKEQYPNANTQGRIKSLFNLMLDYALEYEIVNKNYARTFSISDEIVRECNKVKKQHIVFSDEEINILWENTSNIFVQMMLIQCYSGWRPQELCGLKIINVDIENETFNGGIKTASGINRTVPIHSKIKELVLINYNKAKKIGSEYLFNNNNKNIKYEYYNGKMEQLIFSLQLNEQHRPHDGRKHFVTMAKNSGVDEYAIKYIVGHAISDITEKIYTVRNPEWLKYEIEKIK